MQTLIVKDGVVVYIIKPYNTPDVEAYTWTGDPLAIGDSCPNEASKISVYSVEGFNYGGTACPSGIIVMWSGPRAAIPSGWALCDGTNGTPDLRDRFIKSIGNEEPGATGGGAYTPTGTVSAPTFTGNQSTTSAVSAGTPAGTNTLGAVTSASTGITVSDHASHTHNVTSNVSVADHAFTQPTVAWPVGVPTAANESAHTHSVTTNVSGTITPAGTIAWPVGVPTHSGITIADHASHTHTYTDVPNHVHVQSVNSGTTGGLSGYTPDTSTSTSVASGYSTANPTGGVATGTTAGPSATLSHTVSSQGTIAWPAGVPTFTGTASQAVVMTNPAVTSAAGSAHTHTISWPAGVPTASGGAVSAHTVTNNTVTSGAPSATLTHTVNDAGHTHAFTQPTFTGSALGTHTHTVTPAGTISAPVFTGTEATPEPAYYKLAFIMKL